VNTAGHDIRKVQNTAYSCCCSLDVEEITEELQLIKEPYDKNVSLIRAGNLT
jgi:hypothetical protein